MAGSAVIGALRVNLGLDSAQFSSGLKKAEAGLRKAESNVVAFSRNASRDFGGFSRGVQNASFQLQDFAVQVEMGTSVSRALSQQLPQLLGGFGALGAAMGVVAAIGIPVVFALMGKESVKLEDGLKNLTTAIGSVDAAMQLNKSSVQDIIDLYGEASQRVRDLIAAQSQIAADAATAAASDLLQGLLGEFADESFFQVAADGFHEITAGAAALYEQLEISLPAAEALQKTIVDARAANGLKAQAEALAVIRDELDKQRDEYGNLKPAAAAIYEQVVKTEEAIRRAVGSTQALTGVTNTAAAAAGSLAIAWQGVAGWVDAATAASARAYEVEKLRRTEATAASVTAERQAATAKEVFSEAEKRNRLEARRETQAAERKAAADKATSYEIEKLIRGKRTIFEVDKGLRINAERAAKLAEKSGGSAKKAAEYAADLLEANEALAEKAKEIADQWQRAKEGIGGALQALASGKNVMGSLGGGVTGIADALFGPTLQPALENLQDGIGDAIKGSLSKLRDVSGLSPVAFAGVGMGIASAASGAMEGDSDQIGSGIGAAAGAALGSFVPGIGTALGAVLGGVAGGFLSKVFGGGEESKWKRPTGRAFTGTTFESAVMGSRAVNAEAGASQAGKFAFQGTVNLLADFNKELGQYVESLGGTMRKGLKLVVDNDAALRKITGTISDRTVNRGGESEDDAAERISRRVSEIMGLAAALAQNAGPALTETQTLWRETQERFSKTNVLILKDLGFAAREIRDLQGDIQDDLREGFSKGLLDSLVDSGRASRKEIDSWRRYELDSLEDRRKAAVRTAREIGASVDLVNSAFRAERREISEEYRELLDDMAKSTAGLQDKLARLESKRAGILQELTRRSDEALRAEEALRDARRGLATGALAPGGPRDVFAALKGQFADAIKAAKGGDADAASRAAAIASALLESGRGVFASGTDYAKLFKDVNASLLAAQHEFDERGDKIAKALDDKTFKDVNERSTRALLAGLQRLDERLEEVAHEIKRQTRETRRDGQRKSVG